MNSLLIENITKSYDNKDILNSFSLSVDKGESLAIIGKSGSGKSTLLQIISGLSSPDSGDVFFLSGDNRINIHNIDEAVKNDLRKNSFGFIYQQHFLLKDFSVMDNLLVAKNDLSRAKFLLDRLGVLDKKDSHYNKLSGGERQRVSICRALMNSPSILFADEPTGNLDARTSKDVWSLLYELQKKEMFSIIIVTHDQELANNCNKIIKI